MTMSRSALRSKLVSMKPIRAMLRLLPSGPTVVVRGYESKRIPASIVPFIVENIDEAGIHRGTSELRLDGGRLFDLAERDVAGLTLREMIGLYDAGDVGLESAALTFVGDVVICGVDKALIDRAQVRGSEKDFAFTDTTISIAVVAASVSGRALSGAH